MPDWYVDLLVADRLNMNPIELAAAPEHLYHMGLQALTAEKLRDQQQKKTASQGQ